MVDRAEYMLGLARQPLGGQSAMDGLLNLPAPPKDSGAPGAASKRGPPAQLAPSPEGALSVSIINAFVGAATKSEEEAKVSGMRGCLSLCACVRACVSCCACVVCESLEDLHTVCMCLCVCCFLCQAGYILALFYR